MLRVISICFSLMLVGCAQQVREPILRDSDITVRWQSENTTSSEIPQDITPAWLDSFDSIWLKQTVQQALANNYRLNQQRLSVSIAEQDVITSGAALLPSLNLEFSAQRNDTVTTISNQFGLNLSVSYELDLWGKLNDAQKQAQLNLASKRAAYLGQERNLAAQVLTASFDANTSALLLSLFEKRLATQLKSLDVIERAYRSGLNDALDVYLAQNTLQQEQANVAKQRQLRFESLTRLELLVADYPGAALKIDASQITMTSAGLSRMPNSGIPAQLLERRPDIQEAWLTLLAADAGLAIAHKNRFPGLKFTARLSDNADKLGELLEGGSLPWSLGASLLQPLFQGGRLKALEEKARLQLMQQEQVYLDVVYKAFAEVENALSNVDTLAARIEAFIKARSNAEAALILAFDQYQRGLVAYTTVLESERRAFDAQTTLIQLQNQQLNNRVILLLALGGNY